MYYHLHGTSDAFVWCKFWVVMHTLAHCNITVKYRQKHWLQLKYSVAASSAALYSTTCLTSKTRKPPKDISLITQVVITVTYPTV